MLIDASAKIMSLNVVAVSLVKLALQWRHNECDGVSNHQPHDCLLNRLFKAELKETTKLRVTGFCEGNSTVADEFSTQRASNAENVFIWWRHRGMHFTNDFAIVIRIRWKIRFAVRHQVVTDFCAAVVPRAKMYSDICFRIIGEQYEISKKFESQWKNRMWNRSQ